MPFGFCTRDMMPWTEFAEDCENGPSTVFVKQVIENNEFLILSIKILKSFVKFFLVSSTASNGDNITDTWTRSWPRRRSMEYGRCVLRTWWNFREAAQKSHSAGKWWDDILQSWCDRTACVRHNIRTNRCEYLLWSPSSTQLDGLCDERSRNCFQSIGNGNRCGFLMNFDILHAFELNSTFSQVNFGPFPIGKTEMLQTVNEDWWHIEARSAAISHSYYTVALNRIGVERFRSENRGGEKVVGPFFGSSYITAPDGSRTKVIECGYWSHAKFKMSDFWCHPQSLSRDRDGILYAELDLNMCQLVKKEMGFDQSQRWPEYIDNLMRAAHVSYEPQIIRCHSKKKW